MKRKFIALIFLSSALFVRGQGTFVWDQQNTGLVDGFAFLTSQPMGQPFTPTQSSMDVAALYLSGGADPSDIGLNLRSGSITGTILATSTPTIVPGSSSDIFYFLFSSPVSLTPGTQYYLQPFTVDGTGVGANLVNAPNFSGGAIVNGATRNDFNFWFQEGSVVPEPSPAALLALGVSVLYFYRLRRPKT